MIFCNRIWEKKFGRNANHKKKEAQENAVALTRKRGHTSTSVGHNTIVHRNLPPAQGPPGPTRLPPRSVPQQLQPVDAGWSGRSNNAVGVSILKTAVTKAGRKDDKPLHPSWEAKRKLKEKEGGGIVPSQGTKIKFA